MNRNGRTPTFNHKDDTNGNTIPKRGIIPTDPSSTNLENRRSIYGGGMDVRLQKFAGYPNISNISNNENDYINFGKKIYNNNNNNDNNNNEHLIHNAIDALKLLLR